MSEDALITSAYGQLVARYFEGLIARVPLPIDEGDLDKMILVAGSMADRTAKFLIRREASVAQAERDRIRAVKASRANREKREITWLPETGEDRRNGKPWLPEEIKAVADQFWNGVPVKHIAAFHCRTTNAVFSRLLIENLVGQDDTTYVDLETGEALS